MGHMGETEYHVTLTFDVASGDVEGVFTEALFEAAVAIAPVNLVGLVGSADTNLGKVWLSFNLLDTTSVTAQETAKELDTAIREAVLSSGVICVNGAALA